MRYEQISAANGFLWLVEISSWIFPKSPVFAIVQGVSSCQRHRCVFEVMKIKITIKSALDDYATALGVLEASTAEPSPEKVLDVLIARDCLRLLVSKNSQISRQTLLTISQLDNSFKQLILQRRELEEMANWRDILSPPKEAWWWFLAAPPAAQPLSRLDSWSRLDWLWEALTVVMLIVNFSLVTEFFTRFLEGGLDPLGAFAIITQSLVAALAAGGALTTTGRNFIERGIETLHIPQHLQHHETYL